MWSLVLFERDLSLLSFHAGDFESHLLLSSRKGKHLAVWSDLAVTWKTWLWARPLPWAYYLLPCASQWDSVLGVSGSGTATKQKPCVAKGLACPWVTRLRRLVVKGGALGNPLLPSPSSGDIKQLMLMVCLLGARCLQMYLCPKDLWKERFIHSKGGRNNRPKRNSEVQLGFSRWIY